MAAMRAALLSLAGKPIPTSESIDSWDGLMPDDTGAAAAVVVVAVGAEELAATATGAGAAGVGFLVISLVIMHTMKSVSDIPSSAMVWSSFSILPEWMSFWRGAGRSSRTV